MLGAFGTLFLVGLALYVGAEAAASAIAGALTWLRRGAFGLAALCCSCLPHGHSARDAARRSGSRAGSRP